MKPPLKPWERRRRAGEFVGNSFGVGRQDAGTPRTCLPSFAGCCLLLVSLLCGCVSSRRSEIVLDTVTPETSAPHASDINSGLVVYTAPDPHAHFDGSSYHRYYSDYEVRSEDGALVKRVHNDSGTVVEGPVEVNLPAGKYRVHARANGYGWVTVPVVIELGKVTTVHLEHLNAKHAGG